MTIGEFRRNFGNFDENRPPQAVEFCVFTLFSRLPGMASPFDSGIIYISLQIEFSLVLYLKLRQFHTQRMRRTLTSVAGISPSHRFATWSIVYIAVRLYASGLLGRELFAFICVGQSKASGR